MYLYIFIFILIYDYLLREEFSPVILFPSLPIYLITYSCAVPVTGDQSGSVCHDADVEFNLSDNGISENETDTDVSDDLLSAVAID